MRNLSRLVVVGLLLFVRGASACNSPLVLDLEGDDYIMTTSAVWNPLHFDMTGDGVSERTGWLAPGDLTGFLWLDLNHNGRVDGAQEFFGDAMLLPTGERAQQGFQALAAYDSPDLGGNGDGRIDDQDLVWDQLRIWRDVNFDGVSQRTEISPLQRWSVAGFSLRYQVTGRIDGNMNVHQFGGTYYRRLVGRDGRAVLRPMLIEDIYFRSSKD